MKNFLFLAFFGLLGAAALRSSLAISVEEREARRRRRVSKTIRKKLKGRQLSRSKVEALRKIEKMPDSKVEAYAKIEKMPDSDKEAFAEKAFEEALKALMDMPDGEEALKALMDMPDGEEELMEEFAEAVREALMEALMPES